MFEVGRDESKGRSLFVMDLIRPDDMPELLAVPGPYFVCLLAWDARQASVAQISHVVERLQRSGCVDICCWGPDCERVHDVFDEVELGVSLEQEVEDEDGPICMSTWHSYEPLSDAIWFTLNCTTPVEHSVDGCRSVIGLSIGSTQFAAEIRAAFVAPAKFNSGE